MRSRMRGSSARRAGCRSTAISRAATATRPAEVAETIRRTIDAGVAGCSIEDQDQPGSDLYPLDEALRRFSAAKEAVLKSGSDFVLTGRCEVFSSKHPDPLGEAVRRLKAYEAAGADVVYAPGVTTGGGSPRHRRSGESAGQCAWRSRRRVERHRGAGEARRQARVDRRRASRRSRSVRSSRRREALTHRRFEYEGSAPSSTLNGAFAATRDDEDD